MIICRWTSDWIICGVVETGLWKMLCRSDVYSSTVKIASYVEFGVSSSIVKIASYVEFGVSSSIVTIAS